MPLSENDKSIMEEIISVEGKCMSATRCAKCPFRAMCLPEFIYPNPPSPTQRKRMAVDILTHHELIDDQLTVEELKEEYRWDR